MALYNLRQRQRWRRRERITGARADAENGAAKKRGEGREGGKERGLREDVETKKGKNIVDVVGGGRRVASVAGTAIIPTTLLSLSLTATSTQSLPHTHGSGNGIRERAAPPPSLSLAPSLFLL